MPRKTTRESLKRFTTGVSEEIDAIVQDLLYRIAEGDLIVAPQPDYDDDEFYYVEYYGEYGDVGVTCRSRKKINGINPHYFMVIEMDSMEEPITLSGRIGAKAWGLAIVQNRNPTNVKKVSTGTISNLLDSLGIGKPKKEEDEENAN